MVRAYSTGLLVLKSCLFAIKERKLWDFTSKTAQSQRKSIIKKTCSLVSRAPSSLPLAFTLFRQLLQQEPGQCWLSLRLREILRPFISSRGAQIVFKTINTIAGSETGGPIYPVAVLNAEDKTNDNTVCLLWPSPQALIAGLVPIVQGETHGANASLRTPFYCCLAKWFVMCCC